MKKLYRCLLYLLGCFLLNVNFVTGQDFIYNGSINWKTIVASDGNVNNLFFDNALFHDSLKVIPIFQDRVKVTFPLNSGYSIELMQSYYEQVPDSTIPNSVMRNGIKDSIIITSSTGVERKENYILFSIVPLRINKQSGKLERLKIFTLRFRNTGSTDFIKSQMAASSGKFATESVLAKGSWYKFTVDKSGVYKLTYSQLKSLGLSNPADVRIYGNGGKVLPELYSGNVPDDLSEIPVSKELGTDGIFNEGDDILFYAEGPMTWSYDTVKKKYNHALNPYVDEIFYFITENPGGKSVIFDEVPGHAPDITVTSFDGLDVYKKDKYNLIRSGRVWMSESFSTQNSYDYSFSFPGLITSEPVFLESDLYARSGTSSQFKFVYNNNEVKLVSLPGTDMGNTSGNYASVKSVSVSFPVNSETFNISLKYFNLGNAEAIGYFDFIRLTTRQTLKYNSAPFFFRDSRSLGAGTVAEFMVSNATSGLQVWNVTDINNTKKINGSNTNNIFDFKAATDNLKTYIAFDPQNGVLIPKLIPGKIENQNIHGMVGKPFIIITHPDFLVQAQKLAALHQNNEAMSSIVITTDQIYNEFSSGVPDPGAIRNFVKMFYDKATESDNMPRYLLLFGDGSYNNKNKQEYISNDKVKNSNFIITYESANSISQSDSYVSDDYFGMLDDNESIDNGMLDIGIGRFPVSDTLQANHIIAKIGRYMDPKNQGDWRNNICFIGDAGDGNEHVRGADSHSKFVSTYYPNFNLQKVYVDAFPLESASSGLLCPQANVAIANYLNKGLLVLNYTGHGGERGLSKQQIMKQNEDIKVWKNKFMPLFMTATCELSRFDDYAQTTAGEDVLLNPDGGGIGLFTTTRIVFSPNNDDLNDQFYKYGFVKSDENPSFKMGDIFRLTKNYTGNGTNKLNFTFLGDPALSLAVPRNIVVTDSVDHKSVDKSDTLKAYSDVVIKGHIINPDSTAMTDFNGIIYPVIYDKVRNVKTLGYFDTPFNFKLQDNILFRGKATVVNGYFSFNFMMPRDIDYNYGFGKISYYAAASDIDAAGFYNKTVIGGLSDSLKNFTDSIGPLVKLFMNDTTFINGGITDAYPTFMAKVADANGINPGGNSIGHDILAMLDKDINTAIPLNNYFETDLNNYRKGMVTYPFTNIAPGNHTIDFKIWDIFNNSTEASINFKVISSDSPSFQKVYNFPNPFREGTTFFFEHNLTGENLNTSIEIYSISGAKVTTLNRLITPVGYTSGPIDWDGTDGSGRKIQGGIYFYRVIVRFNSQTIVSKTQKMIVIN